MKIKKNNSSRNVKAKVKFKILVVDDNMSTADSIAQRLEFEGFNAIQAYDSNDAITACKKEHVDILVLDIKLDSGNGYGVARALPDSRVLFITGFDIEDTKISEFDNCIGILRKPIDFEEMLKIIRKELKIK